MCDHATETKIIDTVKSMIQKRKMFTAFDVTRIVNDGLSQRVRNGEVKKIVHAMFLSQQMSDYGRETVVISSADPNRPPFVYHPPESDPNSYDPISNLPTSLVNQAPSPTMPVNSSTDPDDDEDGEDEVGIGDSISLNRQGNGFIRIPARFMRAIGIEPHDEVIVMGFMDTVEVRPYTGGSVTKYTTDDRNNLRVYRNNLAPVCDSVTVTVKAKDVLELK